MNQHSFFLSLASLVLACGGASAGILGSTSFEIDFTNAKAAAKQAKWSDPKVLTVTTDGWGYGKKGDEGTRSFWLETTEPVALGVSWRPVQSVRIKVELDRPVVGGEVYARYSPDAKHWKTWQPLVEGAARGPDGRAKTFEGSLRVPARARERYSELLSDYSRRKEVAWASDEEAAVKDILRREPKFFEKSAPFIGYVQFLYEGNLPAGERLKRLKAEMVWAVNGLAAIPRVEGADKGRDGPWRFKAP